MTIINFINKGDVHRCLYIYNDPEHMMSMKALTVRNLVARGVYYSLYERRINLDNYIIDFSYVGDDLTRFRGIHYNKVICFSQLNPQDKDLINIFLTKKSGEFIIPEKES